jgi:hypothetical protein
MRFYVEPGSRVTPDPGIPGSRMYPGPKHTRDTDIPGSLAHERGCTPVPGCTPDPGTLPPLAADLQALRLPTLKPPSKLEVSGPVTKRGLETETFKC